MLAQVTSAAVLGIDAYHLTVEVDVTRGLPAMSLVGLAESSVREGRERVLAALQNSGFTIPPRRITVNLAPADVRKAGGAFDLPIAVALLAACGLLDSRRLDGCALVGELGLDGEIRPVRGVLSIAELCARNGPATLIVPVANGAEAAAIEGTRIFAARTLLEVVGHLSGRHRLSSVVPGGTGPDGWTPPPVYGVDLADVRGQGYARRVLEIAAAGAHNMLKLLT
jgi:magnesium chelatase family protein